MIDFDKLWKPSSVRTYYAVLLSSVEHGVKLGERWTCRGRLKQTSEYVSNKQVRSEASCNSISTTRNSYIKWKDTFNFRKVSRYRKFECNFENFIDKTRSCILSQKESLEGFFQRKNYMEISFRYIRNLDSRHSHGMYLKLSPTSLFFRLGLLYSMSGEPLIFSKRAHPLKKYQHFL